MKKITKEDTAKYLLETCIPKEYKTAFKNEDFIPIIESIVNNLYDTNKNNIIPLTGKETNILRRTQGIYTDGNKETYEQIGKIYGITRARIEQILDNIKTYLVQFIVQEKRKNSILNTKAKNIISARELRIHNINEDITVKELILQRKKDIKIQELACQMQRSIYNFYGYNLIYLEELLGNSDVTLLDLVKDENIFLTLRRNNIYTITDLISLKTKEIKNLNKENKKFIETITDRVHEAGLLFAEEINVNNIKNPLVQQVMHQIDTNILQLDLSPKIIYILKAHGIESLNGILNTKIEDLCKIDGIEEREISEIIQIIHKMGFVFIDESLIEYLNIKTDVPIKKRKVTGNTKIEKLKFSDNATRALINTNIIYLYQLVSVEITSLMGIGAVRDEIEKIVDTVHSLGYKFENENEEILNKLNRLKKKKEELKRLKKSIKELQNKAKNTSHDINHTCKQMIKR